MCSEDWPHEAKQYNAAESLPMTPSMVPVMNSARPKHMVPVLIGNPRLDQSPQHRAWFKDLQARHAYIVQVTDDFVGRNPNELTIRKGEYLEVCTSGSLAFGVR